MSRARPVRGTLAAELLAAVSGEFTEIVAMLDRDAAIRRVVAALPRRAGVDMAWVGLPTAADALALGYPVNSETDVVHGLVVPRGAGLGGRVMASRAPLWVRDYLGATEITDDFAWHAARERVVSMIAVPVVHGDRLLGVLYGSNRRATEYSDVVIDGMTEAAGALAVAEIVAERAKHAAEVAVHQERHRLALELHDGVGAMLFTMGAGIRRLCAEPGLDEDLRSRLAVIGEQAAEAGAALRGSMRVLSQAPERVALGVALREHCRAFGERTGIAIRVLTLNDLPPLGAARVQAFADVTREALVNVEKHAEATSVVVSVFAAEDGVAVVISDDGVGVGGGGDDGGGDSDNVGVGGTQGVSHPDQWPGAGRARDQGMVPGAGLGLASMTERMARVGGTLTIGADEDGGTRVRAWLPVPPWR